MEKMTKKEKFKKFVEDHRETIAKGIVYTTILAGSVVVIMKAISKEEEEKADKVAEYNSWVDQENEWLDEKTVDHDVFLLHDWTYLFVPKGTETEWVNDRERNPKIPKI